MPVVRYIVSQVSEPRIYSEAFSFWGPVAQPPENQEKCK
jgi:hypothetical protein